MFLSETAKLMRFFTCYFDNFFAFQFDALFDLEGGKNGIAPPAENSPGPACDEVWRVRTFYLYKRS